MLVQGFDLKSNAYNNRFQPYIAYWGTFWCILFILIPGFKVFFEFHVSEFLTACEYPSSEMMFSYFTKFRQTSIFPSSWDYIYSGNCGSVHRSGNQRKWTLSRYAFDNIYAWLSYLIWL